jgi:hypothetical protein
VNGQGILLGDSWEADELSSARERSECRSVDDILTRATHTRTDTPQSSRSSTYDHRFKKIALPVRSAVLKLVTGGLVVRWVTTGESPLLYVFAILPSFSLLYER